jgi:hypothetical protein
VVDVHPWFGWCAASSRLQHDVDVYLVKGEEDLIPT